MAQIFTLELADGIDTANFMSGSPYMVDDGGLEVSLPDRSSYVQVSPTTFIAVPGDGGLRTATIKFTIYGTTRLACSQAASDIDAILTRIMSRSNPRIVGNKGQLSYAWEGATGLTYFRVFGGVFSYPPDILSVAQLHSTVRVSGAVNFFIKECTLTLYVSPQAYGVSIYSNTLVELPLWNNSIVTKQTGGVTVQNPADAQYNWVEIDDADLVSGDAPMLTRIKLTSGATYSAWKRLYMGLVEYPFPTTLLYDFASPTTPEGSGDIIANAGAHRGYYREYSSTQTEVVILPQSTFAWSLSNNIFGTAMAFVHSFGSPTNNRWRVAVGVDDYVSFGLRTRGSYVNLNDSTVPVTSLELPPMGKELLSYGTLDSDLWLGMWLGKAATTGPVTLNLDYLSLLPCSSGLRVWVNRIGTTALTGTLVDCGWKDIQYRLTGGTVSSPFHAMLGQLALAPGVTQRIYFTSCGDQSSPAAERERSFTVQVYVAPTYSTMVL